MENVYIIALHLGVGGVEKAIVNTANLLCERYNVEIISVYDMPGAPAYALDRRVTVRYLLSDIPNREEWKAALREKHPLTFIKESFRAVKILCAKKQAVKNTIKNINDGSIICTRHEDNLVLNRFGRPGVYKIAQLHHDHCFDKKLLRGFKRGYGNIDVFMLLTEKLAAEAREIMQDNKHTRIIAMGNFLQSLPENVQPGDREKTILAAGRLVPVKGFDRLIEAFEFVHREEPEARLRILGEGAGREKLQKMIDDKGLEDCICLAGVKNAEEVQQEMCSACVYAMSSHSEGQGFVLIEACSCMLPTVAFDVRVGPAAVIRQERDGFLVPDGDIEGFAGKLLLLLRDEKLRLKMAVSAGKRAEEYTREVYAEKWFGIMEERK